MKKWLFLSFQYSVVDI